ncbi:hypothetical protein SLS58_006410 [Diplodia intermedia]|uniref:F-box domain-containing protein n=1 Tax=Diplodia intermedia TaxID=856260 RepID=A0ABR3TN40_9PEZI
MEPGHRTLQSLPPEIIGSVGSWLSQKDLGKLRMTSREMMAKANHPWACFLEIFTVKFQPRKLLRLVQLVQSEAPAKAIRWLRIAKADPSEGYSPDPIRYCCPTGQAQFILTYALKKMQNLQGINVHADSSTFDMAHITCDPQACPYIPCRHRIIPAIFQAIKDSGINLWRFRITEAHGTLKLTLTDNEPHEPYAAAAQMIRAAPLLEKLVILNECYCKTHGILTRILPTAAFSSLREVQLLMDSMDGQHFSTFLDNNRQIKDILLYHINLTGGCWVPILKLLRDKLSLSSFRFHGNRCQNRNVYSTWGGQYRVVEDIAEYKEMKEILEREWEGWAFVVAYDDSGTLFPTVTFELGMRQAISLFIDGYYTKPDVGPVPILDVMRDLLSY